MHFLPQEVIEARFGLRGDEGVVVEAMGTITQGGFTKVALLAEQTGVNTPSPSSRGGTPSGAAPATPSGATPSGAAAPKPG